MVIRHRRFASVPPMMMTSTKRSRSFDVMPASRTARAYLMGSPMSRADHLTYDRRAESYLDNRVTDASFLSSHAMEEGYDTARRSRNRDARLLRDATDAIVHSESFATPQASVAARRVARGQSMMPMRAASVPPRPLYPAEVDFWDALPASYGSMYRMRSAADAATTTDVDDYYFPDMTYASRRPLFYPVNPWLFRGAASRGATPFSPRVMAERARSMPPPAAFYSVPEEPRRKLWPAFDDWRRVARARSVEMDVRPYFARPFYYPYAGGYGGYGRKLSPYYMRKLALSQPYRETAAPLWALPTEGLRAHRAPRYLSRVAVSAGIPLEWVEPAVRRRRAAEEEELGFRMLGFRPRVLGSPLARASLARAWRHAAHAPAFAPVQFKEHHGYPMMLVARKAPKQGRRSAKAALIAGRMEDPYMGRRPRSEYAARKYRAMRWADQESIYKSPATTGYYASNPTLPKLTERKAIRTEDGYTKPKNLLSWQYRLDSIMRPSDLMCHPTGSFDRIRQQVRMAQEGMDRHRQLIDRYLPEEGAESSDAAARVLRKMAEMDRRYPISGGGKESREAPY